jgi:DNA-binding protein YbaB
MPDDSQPAFGTLGSDPDEAQRQMEQWAQGFAEKAQRYESVRQQTEQIRLTAASSDGRVRVTVRADGSVTDLELTDKVRSMPPSELSTQILATMRKAQADIAGRVGNVMAEQLGDEDLQTRAMMLDNLRERFPEQEEEPESQPEDSGKWDAPDEDEAPGQTGSGPEKPASAPEQTSPPPATPPRRPQGRRRADDGFDEDDFGDDFDPLRD